MSFITKNANVVLLFLIILSATALVGATVFFQTNFERINTEYNQKVLKLNDVSTQLEAKQQLLDKIQSDLALKTEREEQLGEKFTEVKETATTLEGQKKQLERSNEQLEDELESTEGILRDTRVELEAKKDVITTLTGENNQLKSKLDVAEDQRDNYKDDRDDCLAAKALCTCPP